MGTFAPLRRRTCWVGDRRTAQITPVHSAVLPINNRGNTPETEFERTEAHEYEVCGPRDAPSSGLGVICRKVDCTSDDAAGVPHGRPSP